MPNPVLLQLPKLLRPEHVVEFIAAYLSDSTLPLEYVAKYDEPLLPKYPAVLVMPAPFNKAFQGTHTWRLTLRAEIYLMHADMNLDRATRNKQDMELASQVVAYLERDMKLGGRLIQSFVESETPGAMPPRGEKGAAVVSTRMTWQGLQEARF